MQTFDSRITICHMSYVHSFIIYMVFVNMSQESGSDSRCVLCSVIIHIRLSVHGLPEWQAAVRLVPLVLQRPTRLHSNTRFIYLDAIKVCDWERRCELKYANVFYHLIGITITCKETYFLTPLNMKKTFNIVPKCNNKIVRSSMVILL